MADLGCSPNAAIAYDFLLGKGLRDFQAAAIVGNLQQESKVDPRAFNPGERALGIAQWRFNRRDGLLDLAERTGRDASSLRVQLEWLWHELETVPQFGLTEILSATSLEDAVVAFQDRFERCGACATENRIAFARAALLACPFVAPPRRPPISQKKNLLLASFGAVALAIGAGIGALSLRRSRHV